MADDFLKLLQEGGPLALVCFGVMAALWQERREHQFTRGQRDASNEARMAELRALMAERIEDQRKHASQMAEFGRTMDRVLAVLEGRSNV